MTTWKDTETILTYRGKGKVKINGLCCTFFAIFSEETYKIIITLVVVIIKIYLYYETGTISCALSLNDSTEFTFCGALCQKLFQLTIVP